MALRWASVARRRRPTGREGQHAQISGLLALTLADFGSQVTLLAEPSERQLADAVADLTVRAWPWARGEG